MNLSLLIAGLLAGTGVFLVGVHLLTSNAEQLATQKIKTLLAKTTDKRLLNVGLGAAATALIQSSGVTTVLIVGFVNVGVMSLYQAASMIMGANIGTTITAQITALSAFPVTKYIQALVFIGIMMSMVCKKDGLKKTGMTLAGLGLIFVGLSIMSDSMKAGRDGIQLLFENVTSPFLLFLIGIILTALVQSSSATTSVIIAMSVAGLTIGSGRNEILFIILGTNIGSCVTALMSSMTAGTNARRAALIHLMFNTFGAGIFYILLLLMPDFMPMTFGRWFAAPATQIAMFHTFFNVVCTALFLPFCSLFVKASMAVIKDKSSSSASESFLDERMLASPSLAVDQLERELVRMSDAAMAAFRSGYGSFASKDEELIGDTQRLIEEVNSIGQSMVGYLIKLSARNSMEGDGDISALHSSIGDVMRVAEIADNMTKYTKRAINGGLDFSEQVKSELNTMVGSIDLLYDLTKQTVEGGRASLLPRVDAVEDDIDHMRKRLIDSHIERLNAGSCRPESSGVFINLVSNLERLGDHLTYIAHAMAQ